MDEFLYGKSYVTPHLIPKTLKNFLAELTLEGSTERDFWIACQRS